MWQAPNNRVRAAATLKSRERGRWRRGFHLKRVEFEVKIDGSGKVLRGRMLLSDLMNHGIEFYTNSPLFAGQELSITIRDPKSFDLKAKVMWCQEQMASYKVISPTPFSWRTGVVLSFVDQAQGYEFAVFCHEHTCEFTGAAPPAPFGAEGTVENAPELAEALPMEALAGVQVAAAETPAEEAEAQPEAALAA